MAGPFRRRGDGQLVVTLLPAEAELLATLTTELAQTLTTSDASDPVNARLFPTAYLDPTEEQAEQQWEAFAHPDLLTGRLAALESIGRLFAAAAPDDSDAPIELALDEGREAELLGVLNDARLALGTRLGVTEELDVRHLDSRDPRYPAFQVYDWLTYLQAALVDVLLLGFE